MILVKKMAESSSTEKTASSNKDKRMFGLAIRSWEQLMLVSLGITGVAAVAVFITTASVVALQRQETAQAERDLKEYKLSVEGKVADAKMEGLEVGKIAGDALVRASEMEKEAASAKLQTEQIKQVVAWRVIAPESILKLVKSLRAVPGRVNLRYTSGDPESLFLAIQISKALTASGWQIAPGSDNSNSLTFGINLPDPASGEMIALREAVLDAGISFSTQPLPSTGSSIGFNISTFAGAPTLMIGSRSPPILQ
jgi:hypothetical protein